MLWAIYCLDNENTTEARNRLRAIHREHLDKFLDKIFFSGPILMDDDEDAQIGSLFILNATRAEVDGFLADEPFNQEGVFASVSVRRMRAGRYNPLLSGMEPQPEILRR